MFINDAVACACERPIGREQRGTSGPWQPAAEPPATAHEGSRSALISADRRGWEGEAAVPRATRAGAWKSQPAQRSEQDRLPAVLCGVGLKGAAGGAEHAAASTAARER